MRAERPVAGSERAKSDRGLVAGSASGSRADCAGYAAGAAWGKAEEGGAPVLGVDRRERGQAKAICTRARPPILGRSKCGPRAGGSRPRAPASGRSARRVCASSGCRAVAAVEHRCGEGADRVLELVVAGGSFSSTWSCSSMRRTGDQAAGGVERAVQDQPSGAPPQRIAGAVGVLEAEVEVGQHSVARDEERLPGHVDAALRVGSQSAGRPPAGRRRAGAAPRGSGRRRRRAVPRRRGAARSGCSSDDSGREAEARAERAGRCRGGRRPSALGPSGAGRGAGR